MQGLTAHKLACIRGDRPVFAGLDMAARPGEALILSGPNGSGKSSLLRILAGLLAPAAGRIEWEGKDVAGDGEAHRARVAYVGHADAAKPALTVAENLAFWTRLYGLGTGIEPALAQFGLERLADLPARYLSAGQRRRLTLARLAAGGSGSSIPALWLLDEPAAGLDAEAVGMLATTIHAHLSGGGLVVVASHGGALDDALGARVARLDIAKHAR